MNISFVSTSIAGIKSTNQDACAAYIDTEAHTKTKGFAFAIADGISSSSVSGAASHYATQQFIKEYYLTPDIWSTEKSCRQLLSLINNNLYTNSKSRDLHLNLDKGYVCTFTGAVIKDNICHLFDIGDSQAYLLRNKQLTLLTEDDEVATEAGQYYLSAGLGMPDIKPLRYSTHQLESDDVLLLLTDGLSDIIETLIINDYDNAVFFNDDHTLSQWMDKALQFGATDNLTLQVIRIDGLSERTQHEPEKLLTPAPLNEGEKVDGLQVIRSLYQSPRSHVYLVKDKAESLFALKCLSLECADDPVAFEQLGMEQWALRRITSRHVVRAHLPTTPSKAYILIEYIEGQTLAQWLMDNPERQIEMIRYVTEEMGKGLQAIHRSSLLHQDIRPANVLLTNDGNIKLIDLGSVHIFGAAGIGYQSQGAIPGTAIYAAPEYFIGDFPRPVSDLYSLAAVCYQMLSDRHPYGTDVAKARTISAQNRLSYRSVLDSQRDIPLWIDDTLRCALKVSPDNRYQEISEFLYDLRHPNVKYTERRRPPLLQRNPVVFWQLISGVLFAIIIIQYYLAP